jgi:hypothetical protein
MKILLVFVLLLFVGSFPASAQTVGKDTLEGVESLWVLVDGLSPAAQDMLDASTLQADVELKLRQAGVRVLEGEMDDLLLAGRPHLDVVLNVMEVKELFVFSVESSMQRRVVLEEDADAFTKEVLAWADDPDSAYPPPPGTLFARTWSCAGTLATAPGNRFAEKARQILANQVDLFLKDYLDANAR